MLNLPKSLPKKLRRKEENAFRLRGRDPGGGGVHNMLRVRVCVAHMGGFLGPKFSKQGSLFRQNFHKQGWVIQKLAKNSKIWVVFHQNSS